MSSMYTGLRRFCNARRMLIVLSTMAGMSVGNLTAATILFSAQPLGGSSYRYTYVVSSLVLTADQEVAIEFNPLLYGQLSNGVAGAGFQVALIDPIQPGPPGRFSALALVDYPSMVPFQVTVDYLGSGTPGVQPFSINQFEGGLIIGQGPVETTVPTPEPGGEQLAALGLLVGGAFWVVRRRRKGTT